MTTYAGDVSTMSEQELRAALADLADRWTKTPHLSNDYSEGMRAGELRRALKDRFGVDLRIEDVGAANYRLR